MFARWAVDEVLRALGDTPVVFVNGPRQSGKSTLVSDLVAPNRPMTYVTLDDADTRAAATLDPVSFVEGLGESVAIDEVQRAPDLFLAIKAAVDRDRRPGRFLLTGSADILALPRLADALVGRMQVVTLLPLSVGEALGTRERFVDACFGGEAPRLTWRPEPRKQLLERALQGGFPEVAGRTGPDRRRQWFASYVTTVLEREVADLAAIEGLTILPNLLQLLAARSATVVNHSELSRVSGLPLSTLKRYVGLLVGGFLVRSVPAWSGNLGKRLVRAPKLVLTDTGLLAHLLALDAGRLEVQPTLVGPLLETFVIDEVAKQVGWSEAQPRLYHFRTHRGHEVDLVLEHRGGEVVGIEVKAAATLTDRDVRGLRALAEVTGERFVRGVVLYGGRQVLPLGERLWAMPVSALWRLGVSPRAG